MKDNKRGFLLQTVKQMNNGAIVSGIGFLLYVAASALQLDVLADILVIAFGVVAVYVLASVAEGRKKDKKAVSYNLLWGQTALTILLVGCAVLTIRLRLGLQYSINKKRGPHQWCGPLFICPLSPLSSPKWVLPAVHAAVSWPTRSTPRGRRT